MNIILIAPPAAGKGTMSEMLTREYNLYHLSTGDLLREISKEDSDCGRYVKDLIDNGKLIDDDLMIKLLKDKLLKVKSSGIIFDGFPRTLNQAIKLNEMLSLNNEKIDKVIFLDVNKEVALKRALGRMTCESCSKIYNIYFDKINNLGRCNECNGVLITRCDDTKEKFLNRFDTYIKNTEPLVEFYKDLGLLKRVSSDNDKDKVFEDIKGVLSEA